VIIDEKPDLCEILISVRAAIACPNRDWYRSLVQRDICGCPISEAEERELLGGALRCATEMTQRVREQYGDRSPMEIAAELQLKIVCEIVELREPFLFLGRYEPSKRTITLNQSAISTVEKFIESNNMQPLLSAAELTRTILFHEIFHALEEETPGIFTRNLTIRRKVLGLIPYKRKLDSLSEVGAVHFSKCMTGIPYSPCIYECLLLLALGKLATRELSPNA
jgi:hypothetical protein